MDRTLTIERNEDGTFQVYIEVEGDNQVLAIGEFVVENLCFGSGVTNLVVIKKES